MAKRWRRHHDWGQTAYHGMYLRCVCGNSLDLSVTPWSDNAICHVCHREYRFERKCFVRKMSAQTEEEDGDAT